jgi:hypothetical protein
MGKSQTFIILAAVIVIGAFMLSAKTQSESKQYEYVSIVMGSNTMAITQGATQYEEIDLRSLKKANYNYGPLFQKINELEAKGFEMCGNSAALAGPVILMRKSK